MMENKGGKQLTNIGSLGEFGLIDHLTGNIRLFHKQTLKGVGDDAAVIRCGDELMVVTKDLLVEGVHFDMVYTPLKHLGYKAVAVNLSDVYAMNAVPRQVVVGLAVSSRYSLEALEELYAGMQLACEKFQVDMVGGDTTTAPQGMTLSITALGVVGKENVVYRKGAAEHDILMVSGDLGAAYCGLLVMQREKKEFQANPEMQPRIKDYAYVLERLLKPEPRQDVVGFLQQAGVQPTSMIDVSDGLASEIFHLCKHSGLGATIYEEKIPVDRRMAQVAHEFDIDPTTCALNGGEDYELLFTIKPEDYDKIKDAELVHPIGHMTASGEGKHMISTSGHLIELKAQGWDPIKENH